jgi:hypothetical protein
MFRCLPTAGGPPGRMVGVRTKVIEHLNWRLPTSEVAIVVIRYIARTARGAAVDLARLAQPMLGIDARPAWMSFARSSIREAISGDASQVGLLAATVRTISLADGVLSPGARGPRVFLACTARGHGGPA